MVCQYSTRGLVSSEKHETSSEVEERGGDTPGVPIAAAVMGGYGPLLEPPEIVSRAAKVAKALKSRTPAKLYIDETLLGWPLENFKDPSFAISGSTPELASLTRDRH
jgi:hypothetical protein